MSTSPERTFGELTVVIEEDLCIGSGNCVNMAPEVFQLSEEGIVEFVDGTRAIDPERLKEACNLCPVEALVVKDAEGEQLVPPV